MNAKQFQVAIEGALERTLAEYPEWCDVRIYSFLGRIVGTLDPVDQQLAEKLKALFPNGGKTGDGQ